MTDLAQVDPDLVGASSGDDDVEQRYARQMFRLNDTRHGAPGASRASRDPLALNRVAANRYVDCPPRSNGAPDERHVAFVDLALAKLACERGVGSVVLRNHHQARCAAVESMDDSGTDCTPHPAEITDVVEQRVDERAGGVARGWMDHHASGLVNDEQIGVVVHDFNIQRFGLRRGRNRRWDLEGDPITLADQCLCACDIASDTSPSVLDESLDLGARQVGEVCGENLVEPTSFVFIGYLDFDDRGI